MNNRRKLIVAFGAGALAVPFASFAQQQGKVWRVGFLGVESPPDLATRIEALRGGLRELGYVEGKNLIFEFRWAEGRYARLPGLANELIQRKVDVIVTYGTPGTRGARQATATLPIVSASSGDLVGAGLVVSLARPGGNITGSTFFAKEVAAKLVEVIKDGLPHTRRVAVLLRGNTALDLRLAAMRTTAKSLAMELLPFSIRELSDFKSVFSEIAKKHADAVALLDDTVLVANAKELAELVSTRRLPSVGFKEFAEAGGLFAYGIDRLRLWRRAAYFVDKIFKGANPGEIPVEQATVFEFIVNMKTAKALGIKVPQSILLRADKVIE